FYVYAQKSVPAKLEDDRTLILLWITIGVKLLCLTGIIVDLLYSICFFGKEENPLIIFAIYIGELFISVLGGAYLVRFTPFYTNCGKLSDAPYVCLSFQIEAGIAFLYCSIF